MKSVFLKGLSLIALVATSTWGQSLSKNDESFIWTLRKYIPKDIAKSSVASKPNIDSLRSLYALRDGGSPLEFKLQFYLDRDVADEKLRSLLSEIYKAYESKDSAAFETSVGKLEAFPLELPSPQSSRSSQDAPPVPTPPTQTSPELVKTPADVGPLTPEASVQTQSDEFAKNPCRSMGVSSARRKCMEQNLKFTSSRILLDPGHYGGLYNPKDPRSFVQDGRRFDTGFQEGYGTFVTAALTKWCLVNCFGASNDNVLLTRNDLMSVGNRTLPKGEVEAPKTAALNYRSEYIESLRPDLLISIHTNASKTAPGRYALILTVRNPAEPHEKEMKKDQRAYENSASLGANISEGLRESYERKDSDANDRLGTLGMTSGFRSRTDQTDYTIYRRMFSSSIPTLRTTPMVMVEGFFHDALEKELAEAQRDTKNKFSKVTYGKQSLSFHPAHQWYAEGLAAGIARFYGCGDANLIDETGKAQH